MASDLIEQLRAATMGFDWADLPDDACIPAVPLLREAATALAIERERAEKAERERDERLEELGRVIMACPQGMRTSPASDGVKQLRASLAEAKRLLDWQPMESAPRDGTIVNVLGRYVCASAGFPRYAGYEAETDRWMEYTRHQPEPLTVWAWRPREDWPDEPARFLAQEEGRG